MNLAWLVPVFVGLAVVLQGGYNRQVSATHGLAMTVLLNGMIFLGVSILLWAWTRTRPGDFPREFLSPGHGGTIEWWKIAIPGICGVIIVTGLPWAIGRLGALGTILILLVTQLVVSMVWDARMEGIAVNPLRIVGASVALVGAWIAQLHR